MILSVREFAKRAKVSRATIVYHLKKGDIKMVTRTVTVKGIQEEELIKLKDSVKYRQL